MILPGDIVTTGCCSHYVAKHTPTGFKAAGATKRQAEENLREILSGLKQVMEDDD